MKKFRLSRRAMLRGALAGSAVAVGMPLLEAMLNSNGDALADGNDLPKRFVSWFWGNGVYLPNFEPAAVGDTWNLSESLQPLAPVKDYVNVCTGLQNRCPTKITHHEGMCAFSGYDIQPFNGPKAFNSHMGGPTIDQVIAEAIAEDTLVRSIHVGCDRKISNADGGTTLSALSHRATNDVEYPEHNPQTVWTLLFGNYMPKDDRDLRVSISDAVKGDLQRLQGRLGATDKAIMDKHMDGLNELEKKVKTAPPACLPPRQPAETNPDIPNQELDTVCDVMDDLITFAFKCDITRVATNLFHYGASHFHFHMLGQEAYEHHNDNSHAGGGNWQQRYTDVVAFFMARLSNLAQSLHAEKLPNDESLLDSTIIYASSDCGPGFSHSLNRQPLVVIGHGRNGLKHPGVHYQAIAANNLGDGNPTAAGNTSDVLLTILQAFDADATQVGDLSNAAGSNTPLEDIRGTGA